MPAFLDGYQGFVQCDAHNNYDQLFSPSVIDEMKPPPLEVGCRAHCRRKFKEAEKYEPEDSKRILNVYKKLYKIEAEIQGRPPDERSFRRQEESVPLLNELFDACREIQSAPLFLPKSPLGQAVAYALKNETALRRYCTKSFLNIDNNVSERTLRAFVIGRKNWLFFGSEQAARNSAVIMSVLSSARRHGLNEWEYLVDILYRVSDLRSKSELEFLLPDKWVKSVVPPTEAAALIASVAGAELVAA
jgi:transposase